MEKRVETLCTFVPSGRLIQIKVWDEEQLDKPIDMEQIRVDPSPFQLVERTSLHKVTALHSLVQYNPLFLHFTYLRHRKKNYVYASLKHAGWCNFI